MIADSAHKSAEESGDGEESGLFGFTQLEVENAIDSAIRLGLTTDERLRSRAQRELTSGIHGARLIRDALVDAGGHSRLERRFLRILRLAGVPRPQLQVSHRDGTRIVARVDALFGSDLVIEVAGHETHSSRRRRQVDAQRQTELTIRGKRLLPFTFEDVFERPDWVVARIGEALSGIVVPQTTISDSVA